MKKIIMMVAAVLMFSAPASMAQKVNVGSLKSKMEKSDADIENTKKAAKGSTWITRGNVYFDALQEPTSNLFVSMDAAMLKVACGEPKSKGSEEINGTAYETYVYPYFTAYISGGKVVGWKTTKFVKGDAADVAFAAYAKAAEIDSKQKGKAKDGMEKISNYFAQVGDISNTLSDYKSGANAYVKVYDIQNHPIYNTADPMMLYYAGYMYTIAANDDPSMYPAGVKAFNRAIEAGYPEVELANAEIEDKDKGNIYYYLYHCYYGQKDADSANLQKAKDALIKGVEIFPKNQRIIDALTQLYTTEKGMGDPSELISMIDSAIESDSTNPDLWFARGRVFFSLEDFDGAIESFNKVTELAPELFDGHFYLGLFYIYKGDALNDEIGTKTYTENAAYEKDIAAANAIYSEAVPVLERAHEIKPEDLSTVEYLKSLCFRLRDEEGIMDKYTKYNNLFNEMKANE